MANVRRLGQPGKTFVHVSVHPADQGLPHVPATCATGAMRESSERFLLAGDVFANTNLDIFDSVLQPAGFRFAHAPLSTGSATSGSLECALHVALRVADTPPAYADVADRATATARARVHCWSMSPAYDRQPAPTTPTQPPAATALDESPIQSTPTAPPTPSSAAVSPTGTIQPTEQAERLHAELQAMEQLLGAEPQPSCTTDTSTLTTTAAPASFIYPPPPAVQPGRARRSRLHNMPTDSRTHTSSSTLQSCSEMELDFSAFESTRRRAFRPAPSQPAPVDAAADSLASRRTVSRRSDGSALSKKSVVIPAEVIGVVNRMTDALLQVSYQSRDDAVARERLLLQQHQLVQRENTEREEFLVRQMFEREQSLTQQQFDRETRTAAENFEREKLIAAQTLEKEKFAATQAFEKDKLAASQAFEKEKLLIQQQEKTATEAVQKEQLLIQQQKEIAAETLATEDLLLRQQ